MKVAAFFVCKKADGDPTYPNIEYFGIEKLKVAPGTYPRSLPLQAVALILCDDSDKHLPFDLKITIEDQSGSGNYSQYKRDKVVLAERAVLIHRFTLEAKGPSSVVCRLFLNEKQYGEWGVQVVTDQQGPKRRL